MSEREVNEDLDPEEKATDGNIHQDNLADVGDCAPSEPVTDAATAADDAKVINKGKAKLIISGAEEAGEAKAISIEPRVAKVKKTSPEIELGSESEDIHRLEREINPGKERIKLDKANFENREERLDEAEIQEKQWGGGIAPGWWVVIAGTCAAVVLIGSLALESWMDGDQAQLIPTPPLIVAVEVDPYAGSPEKWFYERVGGDTDKLNNVLKAFLAEEDEIARSKYVRNPQSYLNKVGEWKVKLTPRLENEKEQSMRINHTEDTAFMVLVCKDSEFMPFRAYFSREGEELKLDWAATVAWSEGSFKTIKNAVKAQHVARDKSIIVLRKLKQEREDERKRAEDLKRDHKLRQPQATEDVVHVVKRSESLSVISKRYQTSIDELIRLNQLPNSSILVGQELKIPMNNIHVAEPTIVIPQEAEPVVPDIFKEELFTEPLLVRCLISRRDEFYAGPYNDLKHSAFMLLSPDKRDHLWAYTARDSALDIELRRLLDHGRFVVALKKNKHVTLRIRRNQKDALPSQVELVEIVHPEWVTP